MPKYTAVIGKSKTNRILTVEAENLEAGADELDRQLQLNPQRREIWRQWRKNGHIAVDDPQNPAPTPTTTAVEEPLHHPGSPEGRDTQELVDMIESAREQIADAAETLRAVANETDDLYRATHMIAQLDVLVGTGGWMALKSETLDGWIEELTTGEEV